MKPHNDERYMLPAWSKRHPGVCAIVARAPNLYGFYDEGDDETICDECGGTLALIHGEAGILAGFACSTFGCSKQWQIIVPLVYKGANPRNP